MQQHKKKKELEKQKDTNSQLNMYSFYSPYHGHSTNHLIWLIRYFRLHHSKPIIFLAGDSSLDNKYWLSSDENELKPAVNGYQDALWPQFMKPDVCYHLNMELDQQKKGARGLNYIAVNCAIEESTIRCRQNELKDQDRVILNNITNDDILIVSVGGNDIALSPCLSTIWNMVILNYLNTIENIKA